MPKWALCPGIRRTAPLNVDSDVLRTRCILKRSVLELSTSTTVSVCVNAPYVKLLGDPTTLYVMGCDTVRTLSSVGVAEQPIATAAIAKAVVKNFNILIIKYSSFQAGM
jgi:hypothetical protein